MIWYPNSVCVCGGGGDEVMVCTSLSSVFLCINACLPCQQLLTVWRESALCCSLSVSLSLAASANTFPRWLIYLPADSEDVCVPSASMWAENKTAEWRQTHMNLCLWAERSGGSDLERKFWQWEETETDKLMFSVKFLRKTSRQSIWKVSIQTKSVASQTDSDVSWSGPVRSAPHRLALWPHWVRPHRVEPVKHVLTFGVCVWTHIHRTVCNLHLISFNKKFWSDPGDVSQ